MSQFIDHDTIMFRENPFIERLQLGKGNNDGSGEGSINKATHFCMLCVRLILWSPLKSIVLTQNLSYIDVYIIMFHFTVVEPEDIW